MSALGQKRAPWIKAVLVRTRRPIIQTTEKVELPDMTPTSTLVLLVNRASHLFSRYSSSPREGDS